MPVYYADEESLAGRRVEGATPDLPPRVVRTLDWKLLRGSDVLDGTGDVHVSEAFAETLAVFAGCDLKAVPVEHGSPHPVRGGRVYVLNDAGPTAKVSDSTDMFVAPNSKAQAYGRPGIPRQPLGVVLSDIGEEAPVALTELCGSELGLPWRGLLARGDFLRAFEPMHGRALRCGWEAVQVQAPQGKRACAPLAWTRSPKAWTTTPPVADLIARIEREARPYDHQLPPPGAAEALDRVAERWGGQWPSALRELLARWNGASLHGGAIGFFALEERAGAAALVGRHARPLAAHSPGPASPPM